MQLFFKISKDTFFQLIARFFSTFSNFILILLLSSSLGSQGLGAYNKIFSIIAILWLFVDFSINALFIKKYQEKDFLSILFLRFFISLLILVIISPIIWFLPYNRQLDSGFSGNEKIYFFYLFITVFLYSIIYSLNAIIQKIQKFSLLIFPNFFYAITVISFSIFAYFQKDVFLFFLANIFGLIVYLFINYVSLKKYLSKLEVNFLIIIKQAREIFLLSLPLGISIILNVLYIKLDVFLLSLMRSTSDVGVYTLAYKFFDFPLNISFFMVNSLYPIFLKNIKNNKEDFYKNFKKISLIVFIFSLFLSLSCYVFAPLIGLIKSDFTNSILIFRILVLSYPVFFLTNVLLWGLIALNKDKKIPLVYLIALFFNIICNIIFIPIYGYFASAVITIIGEVIVLLFFYYFFINTKNDA